MNYGAILKKSSASSVCMCYFATLLGYGQASLVSVGYGQASLLPHLDMDRLICCLIRLWTG